MKAKSTMTPEEMEQWEADVRSGAIWPTSQSAKCPECNYVGTVGWMNLHGRVHRREHGTYPKYEMEGCRCEPCVAMARAAHHRWYLNRKENARLLEARPAPFFVPEKGN